MTFNFADLKAESRRAVHDVLGVDAFYQDDSMSAPERIRARWFNKVARFGDLVEQGYAEVIEGVDRIVVYPCDTPVVTFRKGGVITFPVYNRSFVLNTLEPSDGPDGQAVWQCTVTK